MCFFAQMNFSFSQGETYTILNLGTDYSTNEINTAFANANLCGFYFTTENREITFDDGTIVELKKQSDLPNLSDTCFISYNPNLSNEIWEISSNGYLLRKIQIITTK